MYFTVLRTRFVEYCEALGAAQSTARGQSPIAKEMCNLPIRENLVIT